MSEERERILHAGAELMAGTPGSLGVVFYNLTGRNFRGETPEAHERYLEFMAGEFGVEKIDPNAVSFEPVAALLPSVTGEDIFEAYDRLYGEFSRRAAHMAENNPNAGYDPDRARGAWAETFGDWLCAVRRGDMGSLSLGNNYVGKKTRALLLALGVRRPPRNKKELGALLGFGKGARS